MTVICDWLNVTFSPDDAPERAVLDVIHGAGGECLADGPRGSLWAVGGGQGKFRIEYGTGFHKYGATGDCLAHLRGIGLFLDYLGALAESPHKVTRLDAAHDVPTDAAPIIARLIRRYPRECALTRKAVPTKWIMGTRLDGAASGTFYAGDPRSSAKVLGRVYDKTKEIYDKAGVEVSPLTRYEVVVKGAMGPTLRDAAEPERIFWHFASPALLKRSQNVSEWVSGWGGGWTYQREEKPLAGILKARIEESAELAAIVALAERADCMEYCLSLVERTIKRRAAESSIPAVSSHVA